MKQVGSYACLVLFFVCGKKTNRIDNNSKNESKNERMKSKHDFGAYCEAKRPDLRSKTVAFRF